MTKGIRQILSDAGVTNDRIEEAIADGSIVSLTFETMMIGPNAGRYTADEVVELSGVDPAIAEAMWVSLGFPVADEEHLYSDVDLDSLRSARMFFDLPAETVELLNQTRTMASALAKMAESMTDRMINHVRAARAAGEPPEETAAEVAMRLQPEALVSAVERMFRRQMIAVFDRRLHQTSLGRIGEIESTIGFADLTGFTRLSHRLTSRELATLVDNFEAQTIDTVTEFGGRVVKTIGDEVMFVADQTIAAVDLALRLSARSTDNPGLPDLRIGLARGQVVARRGDYYGDAVNLAARLTDFARPGTVLASQEVKRAAENDDRFLWRSMGRVRLKDVGSTPVWVARPAARPQHLQSAVTFAR